MRVRFCAPTFACSRVLVCMCQSRCVCAHVSSQAACMGASTQARRECVRACECACERIRVQARVRGTCARVHKCVPVSAHALACLRMRVRTCVSARDVSWARACGCVRHVCVWVRSCLDSCDRVSVRAGQVSLAKHSAVIHRLTPHCHGDARCCPLTCHPALSRRCTMQHRDSIKGMRCSQFSHTPIHNLSRWSLRRTVCNTCAITLPHHW